MMKSDTQAPRRTADVDPLPLGEELVLYQEKAAKVHVLNSVAAHVWKQCDGRRSIAEIINGVVELHQVDPAIAATDVAEIVQEFVQRDLLVCDSIAE